MSSSFRLLDRRSTSSLPWTRVKDNHKWNTPRDYIPLIRPNIWLTREMVSRACSYEGHRCVRAKQRRGNKESFVGRTTVGLLEGLSLFRKQPWHEGGRTSRVCICTTAVSQTVSLLGFAEQGKVLPNVQMDVDCIHRVHTVCSIAVQGWLNYANANGRKAHMQRTGYHPHSTRNVIWQQLGKKDADNA